MRRKHHRRYQGCFTRLASLTRSLTAPAAAGLLLASLFTAGTQTIAQTMTAPDITSEGPFLVDEGETVVATLTADDSDTTAGDLIWSKTGGADSSKFSLTSAGVLTFSAAKDYEAPDDADGDGTYEVTVQVSDGSDSDSADLVVTLENVVELTALSGPSTVDYEENRAVRVATYLASSEADQDGLTWSLSGADADSFRIDEPVGVLRFDLPVVFPNLFSPQPDYEAPTDTGNDGTYEVTVEVSDGTDTVTLKVTVTITNLDEAGAFSLFPTNPLIGTVVQARLSDPDEPVNEPVNEPVWEWARSSDKSSWTAITDFGTLKDTSGNVTTAPPGPNYAPGDADTGMYFRVRVAYTDGTGSRKTLQVISNQVVRERAPAPDITIVELVSDLTIPWDLAFTPDGTMLFTERPGKLSARLASGTIQTVTADFSDLQLLRSNGLLAIVVDHDFATNRRFYTCQSHTGRKVQIIAWTISSDYTAATRVADPLVGDIPSGGGGHPGCRLRIGPEGYLWIATGDGYSPSAPQDLGSLAGKILRVDVTAGDGAPGNPFSSRVYSYGHRDPQGLALRPGTTEMWSMEHGPNWDDEINLLVAGANYGWDPADGPGYNHKAPMTDLRKFPDALEAKWSSEKETLAISGGIFLDDSAWGAWNGRLAVAALKAQSLNLFEFDSSGTLLSHVVVPELHEHYGRLRTPMTGPDGALYVTTSNGTSLDYILKVVPSLPPQFSAEVTTQSVEENRGASTVVATVTAIDPEGGAVTYTLGGGEDARNFNIANPDIGEVRADAPLDYETKSSYTVDVIATDPWGLDDAITLTINVENIDELPEFPSATMTRSVAENTGPGVSIGAPVTATTVGAAVTYTLGGTDAASFDIVEATGQLQTKAALDYETRSSYEVTVTATNLEGSVDIMVTIDVTNVIELQPLAVTTCSGGMAGTYPCRNVDLMSFLALADIGGGSANDVWGWTDSSTGKEYAIMGRTNGTSFVDISDPVNPIYLGNLPPHSDDSTGRDIKVYADHAFIVTEANNSGMQVFDLTQLRMVASPPATFSETAHYPDFSDAHNLAINEESGFAYAVGTNTCSGGLHMINIQTPTNPTSAACFSGDGYTHDAQCVIYDGPDLDHKRKEICFNSNKDTLTIVDVTNKAGPVMLSRTGYSGSRYAHQGWLTEDQVYFLLGDELDEANNPDVTNTRTYMWDVSDLDDPALIGSHDSTTTAIDHNQYVKGNYTYQSNYQAGLRILDITDIANGNLSEAAFFDVNPGSDPTNTDGGTWSNYPFFDSGIVIVSVIEQGLFILRPNLVDGVNPALSSASVNGAALTLTYGEALDEGSRPAPGDFTVQVDGSGRSVSGVSVSGRVVTLTLASVVAHDETVTVSYSPGANPIRDAAGNGAIGLSNEPVANETPETALPNMWLNPTKSDPVASVRSEATYTVTFQGAWNTTVTAGGVPSGGHFTTLIGGVHNAEVTFLKEGGMATAGVEIMAELGGTGTLTNEVRAAEPNALSVLQGSAGNIGPTGSSTINMVTLTTDHPRVTLLSMVAPSPDWFVGVSGLSLLDAGADWLPSQTVNLYPWDAGTEEGTEFSLTNSATSPQEIITSLRGIGKFSNERIATLTFTRQSVNTAPSFTGDTRFEADENQTAAGRVAAADPDSGDGVAYAITGGADASKFGIGETTGVLTFQVPPNYERAADVASADPVNGAGNNEYIVTVTATGGTGDRAMTTEQTITATVRNVEEAGTISFSQVGSAIRARLSDPDGGVNGATWQWARSSNRNTGWTHIGGATSARYTPSSGDQGMYLQATVSYDDAHSSGKQAQGISATQIAPPNLRVATLVSGLSIPWDIAFTPDGTMLFTQRAGVLSSRLADGTVQTIDADFGDLFASGETGLMGIVVDPAFVSNRRFYTCQGHTGPEIQVIAWTLNAAYTQATRVADPLVGGLPASSDRHGGCRLRFGPEGYLWIATGDAASGTLPQDLTSLGGKVLRVDASTGAGAPTNPFAPSRVYTYGHRNVQGLALRPGTSQMWSVEHGPSVDDEINLLVAGRNYGWNPVPGYNESVPMTDLVEYPDAVEAKWSSGSTTRATSGGIFLEGNQWGVWEGRLAVATLADSKLRLFEFTPDGAFVSQLIVPELNGVFGRLRTPMMGPDGALYVSTSNGGSSDRILRIAEDDPIPVTLKLTPSSIGENGGGSTVTASQNRVSITATTVTVSATAVSPAVSRDFMLSANKTLTITGGQTSSSGTVTITANNNTADTPNKTVRVSGTATNSAGVTGPSDVTLTIIDDDDPPTVMLDLMPTSIGENGGSTTVTARLNRTSSETTTVTVSATAVSPAVSRDFRLSANKTLTITAGQTSSSGTVTITANNNTADTPNKTVRVSGTASNSHGVTDPDDEELTITDDDDAPELTLTVRPSSISESGGSATVTIEITNGAAFAENQRIPLAFAGTASKGTDYTVALEQLTLTAGETLVATTVTAMDDAIDDDAETILVTARHGGGALGAEQTITITDDDASPAILTTSPILVDENETAVATLTASDADLPAEDLTWRITGGADRSRFRLTSDGVLTFAAPPDYEAPGDSDGNGDYEVTVEVSDGANPVEAVFTIRLEDVDDTPPALSSASVNGAPLTLTYDEALDEGSRPAPGDFTVQVDGSGRSVSGVLISGSVVTLTLNPAVEHGETGIQVSYTPGTNPIQDAAGNDARGWSSEAVTNETPDTTSPTVSRVEISSDPGSDRTYVAEDEIQVTVTFSETVEVTGTPQLRLELGGGRRTADYQGGTGTAALVFVYEVDEGDEDTDGVSIEAGRIDRNGGTIKDEADNNAVRVHGAVAPQAGHKVDGVRPELSSAAVDGSSLTLTYGEALDEGSRPAPGDFTVQVDGSGRSVSGVLISGSVVTLTLNPAVEHGDTGIQVSYRPGTNPIQDAAGNDAWGWSSEAVTNETPDTTSPTVSRVEISSDPGSDRTYVAEDEIQVTVTFSETVEVEGTPQLRLRVGSRTRTAGYLRGTDTAALVFGYEVADGDEDTDGVSIEAGRIALNGGTIKDEADNNAVRVHGAVAPQAGHKVDGVRPAFVSAAVDGASLTLTYGEALDGGSRPATGDFTVQVDGSGRSVSGVSVSGSVVILTLNPAVEHGETGIRVSYTPGTRPIQDTVGNDAVRLSNEQVPNNTGDTTAPTVSRVEITSRPERNATYAAGTEIAVTVTFSETVAVTGTPRLSLNVGGVNRSAAYRSGTGAAAVFVYMVADGESDTDGVSIDANSLTLNGGRIRDGANNNALLTHDGLAANAGHKVDGVKPALAANGGAVVNGAPLTLTYDEALDEGSRPAPGDFTVQVDGSGRSVSGVLISGSVVTLTLNPAVEHGETGIQVSYTPGTNPIQDAAGNDARGWSSEAVTNETPDTTSPTVSRVEISSDPGSDRTYVAEDEIQVTVTFNETVVVTGTPQLTLKVGGQDRTANYQSGTGGALVFAYEVADGDEDTDGVSIEANRLTLNGGTIRDGSNNNNAVLDHKEVAADSGHKVDAVKPQLAATDGAVVDGTRLTLTYDEALDPNSRPAASDFTVSGGNSARTVSNVAVSGQAVTLTLDPDVEHGETGIRVSYRPGTNPIQDGEGNDALGLSNQRVTNNTGDTTAPTVSRVETTSRPQRNATYAAGQEIVVTVTFSETVVVTGTPRLSLNVGSVNRPAAYRSGPGAAAVFVYMVADGESDTDGVSIDANSLTLNGGRIRDGANNNALLTHDGLAANAGHKVDGVKPALAANGGAVVNGTTLTLTFGERLDGSSTPQASAFTVTGGDTSRTVTDVALSGSAVLLTVDPAVEHGETGIRVRYTVPTGTGSIPLQDVLGNDADRLSNVPVTNETPDTTSPTVSKLEITSDPGTDRTYAAGDEIRVTVTFSEPVDVERTPRLMLKVGDRNRPAGYLEGTGTTELVFGYEVADGDEDTDGVSVEADRLTLNGGTIRDGSNNNAVLDHDGLAANSGHKVDGAGPDLAETGGAVVNGTTLTLTYDEALDGGSRPVSGDFTVSGGDRVRTVTGVRVNGSGVELTLDVGAEHGEAGILVSYTVPTGMGANPIRDVPGNDAEALSRESVTNETPDTTSPEVSILAISSNPGSDRTYAAGDEIEVTVTFDETVVVTRTPRMRLRVGSRNRTAGYLRGSGAAALVFSYEVALGDEDTDGVSIAAGRIDRNGGTIKDEADNDAVLDHEAVAPQAGHKVDGVRPEFLSAAVDGSSLTLTYGEALDPGSRPAAGDFTVEVDGSGRSVSGVSVSGSVVTLFLTPAVEHGDTGIRVNYSPGTRPIRDAVGNDALALSNRSVANTTGAPNTAPEITSPSSFDVRENQSVARRLVARDIDPGDEVTGWEIVGGADRLQFSVAPDTGELSFRTAPDFEAPGDNEYEVTVEVRSGTGARELEAEQTFTVRVTDEREPPGIPEAPTFSGETAESMTVNWSEPDNTGPAISDYDVQYWEVGSGGFTDARHEGTGLRATLTGLSADTVYEVQVRATNDEGTSDWSESGEGMTVTPLTVQMTSDLPPPVEGPFTMRFSFSETVRGFTSSDIETQQEPACTDSANNPVSCNPSFAALQTTDDRIFTTTVTPRTDQVAHNYTLTITLPANTATAVVGNKPNEAAALEVRIAPPGVTVPISSIGLRANAGNGQVTLNWNTPANNGGATIIRYEYRFAAAGEDLSAWENVIAGTRRVTVGGLINGSEYVFEVRAVNALGKGETETVSAPPDIVAPPPPPPPPPPQESNFPTADAGPDQSGVWEGALVTLDGSGSSHPDDAPLRYRWNQLSGEPVVLSSQNVANPTFTAPVGLTADAVLIFRLLVTDPGSRFDSDTVTITVDPEAEPPPAEDWTYYFPHLAVGAGWQTTITYINYSPQQVSCRTDFLSDQGTPLMVSFADQGTVVSRPDVLPPGGSVHQETNVELSAPLAPGWARATCSGPVKANLLFRQHNSAGVPVAEAGVNAAEVPATRFVTFAEQGEGKFGTGVAYANPSVTAALVTFTARDADGLTLASVTQELSAGGHGAQNMAPLFGLSSFTGLLEVTSSEPIVTLSLNFEADPVFSSLPPGEVDAAAQGATTYYFPHLAVGARWQTTITYINYSPQEVTCQTEFLSDFGSPLMVSFAGLGTVVSRPDVLPPGGSVHQETNLELSAPLAPGWARVTCTGPVKASLLFRLHNSEGVPVAEAGVNAARIPATRFVTFAEQGEGQLGTGVAYSNPSDTTTAFVIFTVRDAAGNELARSAPLTLLPRGHGAQNMAPLFGLTSFTGSLEVTSTAPIVSLSLNFEAAPVFSSLPPGEVDDAAQ